MPAESVRERLSLLTGGVEQHGWESFEIDSDLMVPADCWRVTLGVTQEYADLVKTGASCELRIAGATVMTGRIDGIDHEVGPGRHTLAMNGRDGAAVLVDCSAPVFVAKLVTLEEIIAQVVRPLGITRTRIDADSTTVREKINIEPGDSAWAALSNAAEANGLWPWFEPDGTLVVGGPDYNAPPVAKLALYRQNSGAQRSNIRTLKKHDDVSDRYSEVTVLGQVHGTATQAGRHNIRASVKDEGVSWYRPRIITDGESDNEEVARARARKDIADARVRGFTLEATVQGFHVPGTDLLWAPGQRVEVISEPHRIEGTYFLMGREFRLDRFNGATTALRLKEDGVWTLDAHPHKRKHRRGKNSVPGKVVDLS